MSRIGKKPINIPKGVEIKISGTSVVVVGPKGELKKEFSPLVNFKIEEDKFFASVTSSGSQKTDSTLWGLSRALLNNMIVGVSGGFEEILEFNGVGFKAQVKGQDLELILGFTNPVLINGPSGINFQVEKNTIKVSGIDKENVGQVAALIRAARPPEPYKGTGIKYKDEIIIRKAGKKAVAGA